MLHGNLPVRYLGVPLVTRKLTGKDCTALGVIRDVEKLCMRFFWIGSDSSARGARVSWKQILVGEGSLWIAWVNAYCFRSVDFWHADYRAHFNWILAKMFKLRSEASRLFCSIRNWTQINASWIWDNIRCRGEKVSWHRLVWFPGHIPKFSLISWMAILDRLPTKDRLARFGIAVDSGCGLCRSGFESRDHIFSDCAFAMGVWHTILNACGLSQEPLCWNDLVCWLLLNLKGKSLLVHILKLAWSGSFTSSGRSVTTCSSEVRLVRSKPL
ncbi:hypothetical protein F3Y22_tig00111016pilonHSYRG00071 [Hibiscus syriacus]|uniref:Reverse transcriptase zinc-binding domain-containing protein n=1 Tax=Hibiscus syriacus TaxID=106335 RepID=A0A6A2Z7A4_HIBSY|nr:hypothetical protein F3Y22_tig00111016pilonHSYRG00071 [Hibiscus syriacus]